MKERPILFNAPMVRALLNCTKSQTRRVVKPVGSDDGFVLLDYGQGPWPYRSDDGDSAMRTVKRSGKLYLDETPHACPCGRPGDLLWVKETFKPIASGEVKNGYGEVRYGYAYKVDSAVRWNEHQTIIHDLTGQPETGPMQFQPRPWKPSIHMPRRASRILLEITGVRVERLNSISEEDCWAEGIEEVMHDFDEASQFAMSKRLGCSFEDAKPLFAQLWESINGPRSWEANPWVWVVEFRRIEK
ncbi:hypothetical protein [Pseudomonas sp.]|uniref:hypothetical protein n=1 Tax=Pseudomonas sp. TaxID=306 RepID=UPI003F390CD7